MKYEPGPAEPSLARAIVPYEDDFEIYDGDSDSDDEHSVLGQSFFDNLDADTPESPVRQESRIAREAEELEAFRRDEEALDRNLQTALRLMKEIFEEFHGGTDTDDYKVEEKPVKVEGFLASSRILKFIRREISFQTILMLLILFVSSILLIVVLTQDTIIHCSPRRQPTFVYRTFP